jgi:CubicO group peptidase (beta-lactamase class C family)
VKAAVLPAIDPANIPHDDWDRGPWNRYSFQHVRDFVPTVPVPAAAAPGPWSIELQDLGPVAFETDGARTTVARFLDTSYTDGYLVAQRGRIVMEEYRNGMSAGTPHLTQSVSKSVTGTVAGILLGQGRLQLQVPLTHYLPELEATAYRGATLQHLLDMTSGVYWDENYTALDSHAAMMDVAAGWKARKHPAWPANMWELVLALRESRAAHGARFDYRSIETDVLAFAMERATGLRLAALVSRELWAPMGAATDAYFTVDPTGFACACGGFNATLRDLARFAQLYVTGGTAAGRQLVPEAWIRATRAGNPALFQGAYREVLPNGAYHNQFWIEDGVRRVLLARGVFGQLIFIDPEAEFVAVKLSSWPEFVNPARTRAALAAARAIRDALS